jgi:PmbA protein
MATEFPDLSLCHPWSLSVEDAIELARAAEAAGQAVDARVNNSEGASVNTNLSQFVYANSHGFCHGQQGSRHSLSTTMTPSRMAICSATTGIAAPATRKICSAPPKWAGWPASARCAAWARAG